MHPQIITLDDVLPHIEGNSSFLHIIKDGYSVIDYVGVGGGMFPGPMDSEHWRLFRECRGLIFNEHGMLISRPLSKGMNYGEKPQEDYMRDWSEAVITHKMDGSMVRPLPLAEGWRLATRKGVTEVAMQAEAYLERSGKKKSYFDFFDACWLGIDGEPYTPVFEYIGRENRIVIDYPEESLILLAVRNLRSGRYIPWHGVRHNSVYRYSIPHVDLFPGIDFGNIDSALKAVRELKGLEGVVAFFPSTETMVKIKAEDYCNLHRIKSYIDNERSVVACLVNDQLDDLIPLLSPNQLQRVEAYSDMFWKGFHKSREQMHEYMLEGLKWNSDKRTFAVEYVNKLPAEWRPILFWLNNNGLLNMDVHELHKCLLSFVKYGSQEQVNNSRFIHGAKW